MYLVTGGCGFIGSHLCDRLLAQGHKVRVLDNLSTGRREQLDPACDLLVGDVADPALAARAMEGVKGCFHLAAVASVQRANEDWLGCHRTNLSGSIAIFAAARDAGKIPVIYASSAAVYGDNPSLPLLESDSTRPLGAYGADKLGSELHGRVAWHVHGVPTTGLRFFNVFGPRQDPASPYSGVISIFADRVRRSVPIEIHGDGRQSRDFIFVSDVVAHLCAAMAKSRSGAAIYNVCTGRATSVLELAAELGRVIGREPLVRHTPARQGDIRHSIGSPDFCIRELGLAAQMPLAEGLAATLAWSAR